jgi:hypothetical protein
VVHFQGRPAPHSEAFGVKKARLLLELFLQPQIWSEGPDQVANAERSGKTETPFAFLAREKRSVSKPGLDEADSNSKGGPNRPLSALLAKSVRSLKILLELRYEANKTASGASRERAPLINIVKGWVFFLEFRISIG